MKRITIFTVFFFTLVTFNLTAQEKLVVEPGYGTLNDAYAANGGNKIYVLKAGGWYGLSGTIEITEPFTIIGEKSDDPAVMLPIVQMGTTTSGGTFGSMFQSYADIDFRNIFFVNADLNNSLGDVIIHQQADSRISFDNVVIDPLGSMILINIIANHTSIFITNSLIMRHASETSSIYDYPVINYNGTTGVDTLYIENSTFADMGWSFYDAMISFQRGSADGLDKFIWINHNTFLFGKSDVMNTLYTQNTFFTNNMFYEWGMQPYYNESTIWFMNYGDFGPANTRTSLLRADTVKVNGVYETFPSSRKYFATYNYKYKDPRINDVVKMCADSGLVTYSLPFLYPESAKDTNREARIFNDKTNFPHFIASHNIDDPTNMDPGFEDPKIYSLVDSAVAWSYASTKYVMGLSYPAQESWPRYFFKPDAEIGYPYTWPRINAKYSNQQMLTGSIENLPLGDLNWFPDKKAVWAAHKADIMNHILSLNDAKFAVTAVNDDKTSPASFSLDQNYPNPFNPETEIKYNVPKNGVVTLKVYNLLGQEVVTLVNQEQTAGSYKVKFSAANLASGVYMYRIQCGDLSLTKKMTLLK
jgi:hypothetical protein